MQELQLFHIAHQQTLSFGEVGSKTNRRLLDTFGCSSKIEFLEPSRGRYKYHLTFRNMLGNEDAARLIRELPLLYRSRFSKALTPRHGHPNQLLINDVHVKKICKDFREADPPLYNRWKALFNECKQRVEQPRVTRHKKPC